MSDPIPTDEAPRHAASPEPVTSYPAKMIFRALIFPIFFVVVFSFCYISAFHDPQPREAPIGLVGPDLAGLASQVSASSSDAFDVRVIPSVKEARSQVEERELVGAVVVGEANVTTLTASGQGAALSGAVSTIGTTISAQTGLPIQAEDLAPVTARDRTGSALFYFVIVCTIGGYLTMTVLSQAMAGLSRRRALTTLGAMSVATPVLAGLIGSIFVGTLGAGVGAVLTILAVAAVYTFTSGALTYVANQLFGSAAIMVVLLVVVFINFPSAGGGIPGYLLPEFWQVFHSFWFGASAVESIRDLIYFPGASLVYRLVVLGVWFVVATGAALVVRPRGGIATGDEGASPAAVG